MTMKNPNEYVDEYWAAGSSQAQSAITFWWEAGCSESDIAEMIQNALSDAGTDCNAELILSERQPEVARPLRPKPREG